MYKSVVVTLKMKLKDKPENKLLWEEKFAKVARFLSQ